MNHSGLDYYWIYLKATKRLVIRLSASRGRWCNKAFVHLQQHKKKNPRRKARWRRSAARSGEPSATNSPTPNTWPRYNPAVTRKTTPSSRSTKPGKCCGKSTAVWRAWRPLTVRRRSERRARTAGATGRQSRRWRRPRRMCSSWDSAATRQRGSAQLGSGRWSTTSGSTMWTRRSCRRARSISWTAWSCWPHAECRLKMCRCSSTPGYRRRHHRFNGSTSACTSGRSIEVTSLWFVCLCCQNQLGILWAGRDETETAQGFLETAEFIYQRYMKEVGSRFSDRFLNV